ncbi:MAG: ABC transporter permease [Spirochaetota bacterium]
MRGSRNIAIIGKQEFRGITSTKAYLIMTIIGPILIFAISVLPSLLSRQMDGVEEGSKIAVVGAGEEVLVPLQEAVEDQGLLIVETEDLEAAKQQLFEGTNVKGILEIPGDITTVESFTYYSETGTDLAVSEMLKSALGAIAVSFRMREAGFEPEQIRQLSQAPELQVRKLSSSGDEQSGDFFGIMITTISFILLLYMTIILYGQMIGRSIVTEKTSKTVEIMLSSVRSSEIMFGKIIGIGGAGLLQYAIWVSAALVLVLGIGPAFDLTLPASINPVTLLYLVVFFLAAFALYAGAYAALGAAAEDEQNLGQLSWPLITFLVIPMVMISPIIMNPTSLFVQILSYFPMTSPVVMFTRVLVHGPEAWELILCFAILLCSIYLMITAAGKIFRIGILLHGKRYSFREMLKWLRQPG